MFLWLICNACQDALLGTPALFDIAQEADAHLLLCLLLAVAASSSCMTQDSYSIVNIQSSIGLPLRRMTIVNASARYPGALNRVHCCICCLQDIVRTHQLCPPDSDLLSKSECLLPLEVDSLEPGVQSATAPSFL